MFEGASQYTGDRSNISVEIDLFCSLYTLYWSFPHVFDIYCTLVVLYWANKVWWLSKTNCTIVLHRAYKAWWLCLKQPAIGPRYVYNGFWFTAPEPKTHARYSGLRCGNREKLVCVYASHSFWTSSSLDVPVGVTHRRKVTHDFSSTWLLQGVTSFFLQEGFSHSFALSTVK